MASRVPLASAPRTPPKAPPRVPKPPPGPPPQHLLAGAASAAEDSTALADPIEALSAALSMCSRPMENARPKGPIGKRPRAGSSPELPHLGGGSSSGAAVAKSISKRPRADTALAERGRSFWKGRPRKDPKSRRSEAPASGAASSSATALVGQLAASAVPSDPNRLQLRLTWWGFASAAGVDLASEERIQRNGGIVAFSDLLAPGLPSDWAPEGFRRCEGAGPLQVMVNPHLIPECMRMRVYNRLFFDWQGNTYIELALGVWRAFATKGLAVNLHNFDFAVVSATLKQPQGFDVDPQVPASGVAGDWFTEVQNQLTEWFREVTPVPRFILGHLGQMSLAFADMLMQVTGEHACWAGAGPTALAGDVAFGGVWIIGPHKMLVGSANPEDDHESIYENGTMVELPRVRTACTERIGHEVGTPTLFVGRSKRGSMFSKSRAKVDHVKYASTEHGRCLS